MRRFIFFSVYFPKIVIEWKESPKESSKEIYENAP